VRVLTSGLPVELWDYVGKRLVEMTGVRGYGSGGAPDGGHLCSMNGVNDLDAVAALIDFGEVTKVDRKIGTIMVQADSRRLPNPIPQIPSQFVEMRIGKSDGQEPDLDVVLANLTSWNPKDRSNAISALDWFNSFDDAEASRVVEALEIRTNDVDRSVSITAKMRLQRLFPNHKRSIDADNEPASVVLTPIVTSLVETEVNGIKLVPMKFLGGRVEMLAPADFTPMSDEMARLKYPTANRPSEIITNEAGSVNLAFTYSKQLVAPGQIGQMHTSMDRMFRTVHKTAEWHNSGLKSINGRQWLELDLTMQAADTRIRNMMYGTSSGGRAALVAFNVTVDQEEQWLEAANVMMSSMHAVD